MDRRDLDELLQVHEWPAVTLVAPLHPTDPEQETDPLTVKRLVAEAERALHATTSKREAAPVLEHLGRAAAGIDWRHADQGVALFATTARHWRVDLPERPDPRVAVGATLAVSEVARAVSRSRRYRVLVLTERPTRLFEGNRHRLSEVHDGFPMVHDAAGGETRLVGGFGQSPSKQRDYEHRRFFAEVARRVRDAATGDPLPLFLVSVPRYEALWREAAPAMRPAATVHGSWDTLPVAAVTELVRPHVDRWFSARDAAIAERLDAARSAKRYAGGLAEVAAAARDGEVALAVLPERAGDGTDGIVRDVLTTGGSVEFAGSDLLDPCGGAAAVLRW
jgi:hypothetical protein